MKRLPNALVATAICLSTYTGGVHSEGIAPYYCMFSDGTRAYQDAPCGKQPDPSAKHYDARGRAAAEPRAVIITNAVSPESFPTMCRKQRHLAEADLKAHLAGKYGNSYSLQLSLLNTNMRDYDEICDAPATPVAIGVIDDLTAKYYPSFSLIKSLAASNLKAYRDLHR